MDSSIYAFAFLALMLTLVPGPDTALVTRNTVTRGRQAAFFTIFGIILGCTVHAIASSLGLSTILAQSAALYDTIKITGALYLMWLGIQALRAAWNSQEMVEESAGAPPGIANTATPVLAPHARSFREGLLTNLLNPKVSLFYLMVLPQFVSPTRSIMFQSMLLAGLHIAMGLIWLSIYVLFVDALKSVLTRPTVKRWVESITGTALILLGIRVALERVPRSAG